MLAVLTAESFHSLSAAAAAAACVAECVLQCALQCVLQCLLQCEMYCVRLCLRRRRQRWQMRHTNLQKSAMTNLIKYQITIDLTFKNVQTENAIGIYIHRECVNTYVIDIYIYTCGDGGGSGGASARAPCTPRFWGAALAAMAAIPLIGLDLCSPFVTSLTEACTSCGCVSGRNSQTSACYWRK